MVTVCEGSNLETWARREAQHLKFNVNRRGSKIWAVTIGGGEYEGSAKGTDFISVTLPTPTLIEMSEVSEDCYRWGVPCFGYKGM